MTRTTSSYRVRRVLTGALLVVLCQFGITVWFMIGQGYDRATANLVPVIAALLIPVLALLMKSGTNVTAGTWVRYRTSLLGTVLLYGIGVLMPAAFVLHVHAFSSPFDELWWILGGSTVLGSAIVLAWKGLVPGLWLGWASFLLIVAGGVFGLRQVVFSFF